MVSQATLRKHKLTSEFLRPLFEAKKKSKEIETLIVRIKDRINEGRMRCLSDYKIWAAVDYAHDAPFNQTIPTILQHICETCADEKSILSALREWGLSEESLFTTRTETVGDKQVKIYEPNFPVFYNVLIPFVRAYTTIRLAKIFNDRNTTPFLKYQPLRSTEENRVLCEIWTDIIESMNLNFGLAAMYRQTVFQKLMYSACLTFPVEPWTEVKQENEDGKEETEKEGVRLVTPHITRHYYDLQYGLHTLNTDTGVSFAGYWTIRRWGEVDADKLLWNKEKVPHGTNWLDSKSGYYNYFKEVYPCVLEFPKPAALGTETDREKMQNYYSENDYDSAFFSTCHFEKLIPADCGMGDYKNPVWFKFTMGADDTVMFCEPFSYSPVKCNLYDADSGRGRNASLALEILPFQTIAGNVLSGYLLSLKRNLANIVWYNNRVVEKTQLDSLHRKTNTQYAGINFVGFDGDKLDMTDEKISDAFYETRFPLVNTPEQLQGLNTVIAILERVVGISPQEIGSAASHQQGNKEIELISSGSSNRVAFTGSFDDEFIDALKRQLVDAALAYMGDDVEAQVSADIPNLKKHLETLGFTVKEEPQNGQTKVTVKGKKSKLKLIQFTARRNNQDRGSDMATGQAMMLGIQAIANNQMLSQIADPKSLMELIEFAAKLMGADEDFKVRLNANAVAANQLKELVPQIEQQIMQIVEKQVAEPAAKAVANQQQEIEALQRNLNDLGTIVEVIQKAALAAQPTIPPTALDSPQIIPTAQPQLPPELIDATQTSSPAGAAPVTTPLMVG